MVLWRLCRVADRQTMDGEMMLEGETPMSEGIWVVYDNDWGPYLISAHPSEVEAMRAAQKYQSKVAYIKWGEDFEPAVRRAELAAPWDPE